MVLGDGVDDGVAENIPCAQGWSWSRAGARAAADPEVEGISCTQEWFGWMNGDLHRVAENIPCAQGWFWSRADARAATDPGVEGISCAQEWFRWVNGDLHRVAENIPCAQGWSFGSDIQAPTRKGGGLFCRLFSGGAAVRQVIKLSSFHHPALWKVFQVLGRFHGQGILGPKLFCAFMAK